MKSDASENFQFAFAFIAPNGSIIDGSPYLTVKVEQHERTSAGDKIISTLSTGLCRQTFSQQIT